MSTVLILRQCNPDLTSLSDKASGFRWPESGPVEAPDWQPTKDCGNGLHGFLWGEGNHTLAAWDKEVRWLVVRVDASSVIDLDGKVKFPRGEVIFVGSLGDAAALIAKEAPAGTKPMGLATTAGDRGSATAGDLGSATAGYRGSATAGDRGSATAGDLGSATAGYRGSATAGDRGSATAGDRGSATAGDRGSATAGDLGSATAGYLGSATAGDLGSATAGDRGSATAGDLGSATAGDLGSATAGYLGSATAGYRGSATAGDQGIIVVSYWSDIDRRYRIVVGYVGENGVEKGKPYHVEEGKIVAGEHPEAKSAREQAEAERKADAQLREKDQAEARAERKKDGGPS